MRLRPIGAVQRWRWTRRPASASDSGPSTVAPTSEPTPLLGSLFGGAIFRLGRLGRRTAISVVLLAAAALAATRQAAMNMISPLNLITIGSIAASAAAVQWLTSASKEAETFEDRLQAMSDAVEVFGKRQEEAFQSTADMIKGFGSASPELRGVLQDLAAMARLDAQEEIDGNLSSSKVCQGREVRTIVMNTAGRAILTTWLTKIIRAK